MSESSRLRLRFVVDTNLFVSGVISPKGTPRALLRAWYDRRFTLILSDEQYDELIAVFSRPRLVTRYAVPAAELARLFGTLATTPRILSLPEPPIPVRDPKDTKILATALGGAADYLVSGDKDLLSLAGDSRLGRLQIVTVNEFFVLLERPERET